MPSIERCIRKAIDDWESVDLDFAMLVACLAIDGTAAKHFPTEKSSNARFTRLLREYYFVLGPMGCPGVDVVNTRWPVRVERPKAAGGKPDLADVIYGIHRCSHGHGQALPDGFDLIPDAKGQDRMSHFVVEKGKVRLSDRVIFGLIAVAVLSPLNVGLRVPDRYFLKFGTTKMPINEWWGRAADFIAIAAKDPMPLVKLDFVDWMEGVS